MSRISDASLPVLPEDLSTLLFKVSFGVSQASGALMILLATVWMDLYNNNGISTGLYFRFHPVLMAFGIYLLGNALLMFRILRARKKWKATLAHVVVHSCAIFVMCLAAFIVWSTYTSIDDTTASSTASNAPSGPQPFLRYYSFHTWLGLATITLYIVQYLGGIVIYIHPDRDTRRAVMPFHQLVGVIVFGATTLTASFGTSQQASWKSICSAHEEMGQHILSNTFAISFIVFSFSVLFLICNPRWKRHKRKNTVSPVETTAITLDKASVIEKDAYSRLTEAFRSAGFGNLGKI